MAQRTEVPKFGNWENEDDVPYTAYFDNARKVKSGVKMNPSDPNENTDMLSSEKQLVPDSLSQQGRLTAIRTAATDSSHQRHNVTKSESSKCESESPKVQDALRQRNEHRPSQGEGDPKRSTDSSLLQDTVGRKAVDSPHHRFGGISTDSPRRVSRQGLGSDRSVEQSPLHPNHQARLGNKGSGVSSPSWERKGSSEGSNGIAPSTPGRSRLRSVTRGDEMLNELQILQPDHSPAVPKFGDWDESDPSSAEGFTQVFDRVREEKQSGTGKVPIMPNETSYSSRQKQYGNVNQKGCLCFPWGRS